MENTAIENTKGNLKEDTEIEYEDLNDKLSSNFFGVPNEPFGFSNNKFGMFGPPNFSDVSFKVSESKKSNLSIKIKEYSF